MFNSWRESEKGEKAQDREGAERGRAKYYLLRNEQLPGNYTILTFRPLLTGHSFPAAHALTRSSLH